MICNISFFISETVSFAVVMCSLSCCTEPLKVFTGHKDSVSGLACLSGVLVSVAWDG